MRKNKTMSKKDNTNTQVQEYTRQNAPTGRKLTKPKTEAESTLDTIAKSKPRTMPEPNSAPILLEMQPLPTPEGFEEATGPLLYQMTNDAMFHIVFEACPDALKALSGALLRLRPEEIISIEVTNPVTYDLSIYSKNLVLDLKILLNSNSILNLEMQVEKLDFWRERSLAYLCRVFDNLNRGERYLKVKSAIQVGILDFDLSPGDTKFYSNYYMIDEEVKNKKYSDKLRLSVLQLKQAENATEEDKAWHLDLWAKFFKATTWEEVFMVAEKDPYIANAAQTMYRASADERIRNLCEARERGELTVQTLQLELQMERENRQREANEWQRKTEKLQRETENQQQETDKVRHELQQKDTQLAAALARIAELEALQHN